MATQSHSPIDIGPFRKIRLKVNQRGYWEVWWTDATGGYLTKRESCRTQVRAEAETYFGSFCAAVQGAATQAVTSRAPSIDELCRRWLDHQIPLGLNKAENNGYVLAAVRRLLGHRQAAGLDTRALLDYAHQRPGKRPGTIRREMGALRTVLLWAAKQRLISRDDIPTFDDTVMPPAPGPRTKFLDETLEKWFWDQAMNWGTRVQHPGKEARDGASRVQVFVALGLETAARKGAILDLTWDRVDLVRGTIDYQVPGRRATKKRRVRGLPISDRLLPVLKEAWLRAPKDVAGRAAGLVVGTTDITRAWNRFITTIGVPWVTPHVMRHTWGSLKAMRGAPLTDIARFMGDTVHTVDANYLHLTPDHLRKVANF
jgi:integrase